MSTRELMISIAGHAPMHGERPRWLQRLAKRLDIPERMVRSMWDDEITRPDHWAIKKLRREAELAQARKEAAALANQYQLIAGGMREKDEDFYRTEIDRLERLARIIGGLDRT